MSEVSLKLSVLAIFNTRSSSCFKLNSCKAFLIIFFFPSKDFQRSTSVLRYLRRNHFTHLVNIYFDHITGFEFAKCHSNLGIRQSCRCLLMLFSICEMFQHSYFKFRKIYSILQYFASNYKNIPIKKKKIKKLQLSP